MSTTYGGKKRQFVERLLTDRQSMKGQYVEAILQEAYKIDNLQKKKYIFID